jgi:tetratricopeptide (TPR) repeat protein
VLSVDERVPIDVAVSQLPLKKACRVPLIARQQPSMSSIQHIFEDYTILFDQAERLNPRPPNWYNHHRGLALYGLRRYAEACSSFERMIARPKYVVRYLAASYAQAGRSAEARAAAADALNMEPGFNLRRYAVVEPQIERGSRPQLLECGMRPAG